MTDVPHVIDPQTGEVAPCQGCIDRDTELQLALQKGFRVEQALKRKIAELRDEEPNADEIREVGEYWQQKLHPRSKFKPGDDRWDKVRACLRNGYTVERLKCAIDGAAAKPYDIGYGRRSAKGEPKQRRTDLMYICRGGSVVERLELDGIEWRLGGSVRPEVALEMLAECYLAVRDLLIDRGLVSPKRGVHQALLGLVDGDRSNVVELRRRAA